MEFPFSLHGASRAERIPRGAKIEADSLQALKRKVPRAPLIDINARMRMPSHATVVAQIQQRGCD
jgi:hypothetical protein